MLLLLLLAARNGRGWGMVTVLFSPSARRLHGSMANYRSLPEMA